MCSSFIYCYASGRRSPLRCSSVRRCNYMVLVKPFQLWAIQGYSSGVPVKQRRSQERTALAFTQGNIWATPVFYGPTCLLNTPACSKLNPNHGYLSSQGCFCCSPGLHRRVMALKCGELFAYKFSLRHVAAFSAVAQVHFMHKHIHCIVFFLKIVDIRLSWKSCCLCKTASQIILNIWKHYVC